MTIKFVQQTDWKIQNFIFTFDLLYIILILYYIVYTSKNHKHI